MEWILLVQTRNVGLVTNIPTAEYLSAWQVLGNLEIAEVLRDYIALNPQREQICLFLSSWLGISKWTQVTGFNVAYAKSSVRHWIDSLNVRNAKNASTLHALGDNELLRIESGDGAWYYINCKADCGLCSGAVLKGHKAVQCDNCDMLIHDECAFIAETQYETVNNTNCTWIFPKCEFFNFSDSFFGEQVNLETENRFVPLTKEKKDKSSPCGTNKSSFISGLKFISMNINSVRGKKKKQKKKNKKKKTLELLVINDFHQPHALAIQETKIDSSIATSELFPKTCLYINGGGVMLLVHKDISHMPITELENDSESIWVKDLQTKLLILWQFGIDRLVALVKISNYLENSLITLGLIIRVKNYPQSMSYEISTSKILIGQTDLASLLKTQNCLVKTCVKP